MDLKIMAKNPIKNCTFAKIFQRVLRASALCEKLDLKINF